MNAPCSGAPLTAPHVTTGGLCRWKAINKVGRHVGLDFYDLLIEGHYTHNPVARADAAISLIPAQASYPALREQHRARAGGPRSESTPTPTPAVVILVG